MDGCCEVNDSINFRIPLRGLHMKYLTPTVKNVFNKFSVKFFLRIVVRIKPMPKVIVEQDGEYENLSHEDEKKEEQDEEIDSNFIEIVLWR